MMELVFLKKNGTYVIIGTEEISMPKYGIGGAYLAKCQIWWFFDWTALKKEKVSDYM